MREVIVGGLYLHFKHEKDVQENKYKYMYIVVTEAKHSETGEQLVVYRNVFSGKTCARPKDMFLSEVDHEKYPEITQKYRFEKM